MVSLESVPGIRSILVANEKAAASTALAIASAVLAAGLGVGIPTRAILRENKNNYATALLRKPFINKALRSQLCFAASRFSAFSQTLARHLQ